MSAYENDPRVQRTDPDRIFGYAGYDEYVVDAGNWIQGKRPATVRIHRTDGWAVYEKGRIDGYSVAGFNSADDAIRYLIGDPR